MSRTKQKDVFTTSDVARICHVSTRIVTKWFDTGRLKGYRLPGSTHRRFQREKLVEFMEEHEIPMDYLAQDEETREQALTEKTKQEASTT